MPQGHWPGQPGIHYSGPVVLTAVATHDLAALHFETGIGADDPVEAGPIVGVSQRYVRGVPRYVNSVVAVERVTELIGIRVAKNQVGVGLPGVAIVEQASVKA